METLRKEIRRILKETLEKTERFDLGKNVGDKIYFKSLKYVAMLHINNTLEGIVYNWQIYDQTTHPKGQWVGTFWQNGKIQFKVSDNDIFGGYTNNWGLRNFTGELKKAARYIWLKRQKVNQEIVKEAFGDRIDFPNFEGWYIKSFGEVMGVDGWSIYNEFDRIVGLLQPNGSLQYRKHKELGLIKSNKNFKGKPEEAVRYVWLMNQRPIKKQIGEIRKLKPKVFAIMPDVTSDDMEGWVAKYTNPFENQNEVRVAIKDDSGEYIGGITEKGLLLYEKENGETESVYNKSFNVYNSDSVKQAMRYVWLKRQKIVKEISEEDVKEEFLRGELVAFPDIDNWGAMRSHFPGTILILSSDSQHVGTLSDGSNHINKKSWLGYNSYDKIGKQGWQYTKPWNFDNVKNAVRYVYLKNQKPKGQKVVDEITTNGEGDLMNYYNENPAALNNDYVDNYLMV